MLKNVVKPLRLNFDSPQPLTILIDYSSPNIAKFFHFGHFRATVLGNFFNSLLKTFGHKTHTINYIGDWGFQFALLGHGIEENKITSQNKSLSDIRQLYSQFSSLSATDPEFRNKAKIYNSEFEESFLLGEKTNRFDEWSYIRNISLANYYELYKKLGINFDSFEFESQYVSKTHENMKEWVKKGIFNDNDLYFVNKSSKKIPLFTQEKSTLYLSRDITAFLSRKSRYNFDKIHYVVDSDQSLHFQNMKEFLHKLDPSVKFNDLLHVPFSKVSGQSSRKLSGIYLGSFIDETKKKCYEQLLHSPTTRTSQEDLELVAEKLALSWLFFEILKYPRLTKVNTELHFDNRDLSGRKLQYCNARLCSIFKRFSASYPSLLTCFDEKNFEFDEREIISKLVNPGEIYKKLDSQQKIVINKVLSFVDGYHDVLKKCLNNMDSHHLCTHLTILTNNLNKFYKVYPITDGGDEQKCLFGLLICLKAKRTISHGIRLLGTDPLNSV